MAKRSIKEIKNFNVGTVSNADPRETPDDAATLSYNVDANAPGGVLKGRKSDRLRWGHLPFAKLKVDAGIILNSSINSSTTTVQFSGTTNLGANDYIIIESEVLKIVGITQLTDGSLDVTRAQFYSTATSHFISDEANVAIYRMINPLSAIPYFSEDGDEKENVVLFSENGYVDGVYDWGHYNTDGEEVFAAGINRVFDNDNLSLVLDFKDFPKKFNHNNDISIVKRNNNFFIGSGSSNKSKWLGRIAKANLSGKSGFQLESSRLKAPGQGTDSTDFDKIITFQHSFSDGGTVSTIGELGNTTKVLHIGYKAGTPYLYAIDADNGQVHTSAPLHFNIYNIAKCVSTKTEIKVWAYAKENEDDTTIDSPGSIYLLQIFDNTLDDGIVTTGNDEWFDTGSGWIPSVHKKINIVFAPEANADGTGGSHPRGGIDNYGYPSTGRYIGQGYGGGQEISDILETVDSDGNGKLWLLASPLEDDDEDPYNNWFRTTGYTRESSSHECFRFLWASYERYTEDGSPLDHIKGRNWNDGGERTIWFNDKSFCTYHTNLIGPSMENGSANNQFAFGMRSQKFRYRGLKRSVPTIGSLTSHLSVDYTEPPTIQGVNTNITPNFEYDFQPSDDKRNNYCITNGGGPWIRELLPQNSNGVVYSMGDNTNIHRDIIGASGESIRTDVLGDGTNQDEMNGEIYGFENIATDSVIFKPIPNSLVDLSDLYVKPNGASNDTTVSHVVGCYVNFHKGYLLEDLWLTNYKESNPSDSRLEYNPTLGWRMRKAEGSTCLWISSGGLGNYGAYYLRDNHFGYEEGSSNTNKTELDAVGPFSTLCCDVDEDVIRVMKWLPSQLPNKLTANIRNKTMTEFNGLNDINDNQPKYSALFSSHDALDITDSQVVDIDTIGNVLKLNTTQELADNYAALVTGDPANSLCGYQNGAVTAANYISATDGTDAEESSPVNDDPVFQLRVGTEFLMGQEIQPSFLIFNPESSTRSLDVEELSTDGGLSGGAVAPQTVIPNGPGEIGFFCRYGDSANHTNEGFFQRWSYNGFDGSDGSSVIHNIYNVGTANYYMIPDNNPIFLLNSNSQSVFSGNTGTYESTSGAGTYNLADGTGGVADFGHTKQFYLTKVVTSLITSFLGRLIETQETSAEEVNNLMIGHVWAEGQPAGSYSGSGTESASADTGTEYSRYASSNYRFTLFNRTGAKSAFSCSIGDTIAAIATETDDFSDSVTTSGDPFQHAIMPYVKSKHQKSADLVSIDFAGAETATPDGGFGNYFPQKIFRWYKISYEYDGHQDSPLSNEYAYYNNTTDYSSLNVTITIPSDIPSRATRLNVWRRNLAGAFYNRVKSFKLDTGSWSASSIGGKSVISNTFLDKGAESVGISYENHAEISSFILNTNVNYAISTSLSDYLFVADVSHPDIKERGKSTLVRSQRGKFSMFDVLNPSNILTVNDNITALAGFQGRLYVFTNNSVIRVNPEELIEEDVLMGFGCTDKDGVIVTEYGMFYADKNHIYQHDGSSSKIISYPIETDDFSGSGVNAYGISWTNMASSGTYKAIFNAKTNQVMFAVDSLDSTEVYTNTYLWSYHVLKQRWDLKTIFSSTPERKTTNLTFFNSLNDGSLYTFVYPYTNVPSSVAIEVDKTRSVRPYQWISKKFSMDNDTTVKRFIKVKVEADATIDAPSIFIDDVLITDVTSVGQETGAGTYEYKIAGASKKGKYIQIKWGDGTTDSSDDFVNSGATIFSIGIIYRPGRIK